MRTAILIACLLLSGSAINIDGNRLIEQSLLQEVQNTRWGEVILSMMDIALEANGPLQELLSAIQELLQEIDGHIHQLDAQFNKVQDGFNRDSNRLEQEVNDAQIEISDQSDSLNNAVLPMREQVGNKLEMLKGYIEDNRRKQHEESQNRDKGRAQFQERANQHEGAINAIDECISLLQGISNTGSFAQVSRLQRQFDFIQAQISRSEAMGPLATMIMQITSQQNFSDQGVIRKLLEMFNGLRKEIVEELQRETDEENSAENLFVQRSTALNNEFNEFQREANEQTYQLAAINTRVENINEFLTTRKSDLAGFQAQLTELQNQLANETQIYQELRAEYTQEQTAAAKAYELVSNPDFINQVRAQVGL